MIDDHYLSSEGILFHIWSPTENRRKEPRSQLVLPKSLRYEILVWAHDDVTGAHFGINKTYDKLRQRYCWKGMFTDIEHWCKSRVDCQMHKTPKYKRKAPLLPIPVTSPFDRLSVDFLGSSPVTHSGNRSVVCFTDYLTKWPKVYAIPTAKAPVIVKLIATEILSRHGASRVLLSDRGKNFLSKLVMGVCRLINTKKVDTTAYQPQTNTRVNDSMEQLRTQFLCLSALSRKIGILPVCLSSDSI